MATVIATRAIVDATQNGTFNWFGWESVHAEMITTVGEFVPFCVASTIALVAITVAIKVAFEIHAGDDEVGGISGLAQGGTFERCQNYGELKCKDDNLGGIVGLGQGVTINNCFNSGEFVPDEWDVTGTILGKAEPNKDDNNKKCKVTNCLSTNAYTSSAMKIMKMAWILPRATITDQMVKNTTVRVCAVRSQ